MLSIHILMTEANKNKDKHSNKDNKKLKKAST